MGRDNMELKRLSEHIWYMPHEEKEINPEICVEGHWVPVETDDTLQDLLS